MMSLSVAFILTIISVGIIPGQTQYYLQTGYHNTCVYPKITAISHIRPNTVPAKGANTKVKGLVKITQGVAGGSSIIEIQLEGFTPNTEHGIHIYEYGDLITQGCQSAGASFNPYRQTHGGPRDCIRHVGDLGNVRADAKGKVSVKFEDPIISIVGANSVIGRAFVVHANKDDLGRGTGKAMQESKITGNVGPRLSCGVIVHAKP